MSEQKNEPAGDGLPSTEPKQHHTGDLIERIKESADKLKLDNTSRGDLKILSRTLRELRYAFKVFSPYRHRRKVTVFGSARTKSDDPAYQQAVRFSKKIVEHEWLVVTGAASGIMQAGHEGAGREHSMGLNIMLPFEQDANPIIRGDEKLVHMKYFFTRKLMFVKECHAVVCFPGGFGTLDEGLEVLTLLQTGKRDMIPVVFLDAPGTTYWRDFLDYVDKQLLGNKMISPEDRSLYRYSDNADEAVEEILQFYRVFHSMRYAREKLVLRMKEPVSDELLDAINVNYADILAGGKIERSEMLKAEKDEEELAHLPRLVFEFNRRSLGRLRELINTLNLGEIAPTNRDA